jgi:hypothetical protein
VGDAVVIDGSKFRLGDRISPAFGQELRRAGPSWRRGRPVGYVDPACLVWDRIAGVWRVPA